MHKDVCGADRGKRFRHTYPSIVYAVVTPPILVCDICWTHHCDTGHRFDLRPKDKRGEVGKGRFIASPAEGSSPRPVPQDLPPRPTSKATGVAWLGERAYVLLEGAVSLATRRIGFGTQHQVAVTPATLALFQARKGKVAEVAARAVGKALV